jgi:hypothetical protein
MADSNNKQRSGFFSNAFGVAKKLSHTGLNILNQVSPDTASALTNATTGDSASTKTKSKNKRYEHPQQVLRDHLPTVSRHLLGRHYVNANRVAHFVSPQLSDKAADYFFSQLNQFSSSMSSVDAVLDEAGVRDLEMLTQDVDRSKRISQALSEQNKIIAILQGALTGATGFVGSTVDVPASLVMSLRMIYQVGRSYGFDLSKESDQDIVQFIFKQIDLGLIAEKQTLLMAIKAISSTLQTHDVSQLQQLLGSSNEIEDLKKWLTNADGQLKWGQSIANLSLLNKLAKLTPIASAGVSAVYSLRLVDDVHQKAQLVFSQARQYIIQQKDTSLSALTAYERSLKLGAEVELNGHQSIAKVKVQKKSDKVTAPVATEERVQQGLEQLADQMVEPHDAVAPQQPALQVEEDLADLYPVDEVEETIQNNNESLVPNEPTAASKVAAKPAVEPTEKKVTKRRNASSKK